MLERGLTLTTAESCTGGLIGYMLTEIAGSSDYYVGGLVSYSNGLKERELGVTGRTLEQHGAVSAQTCVAMAEGARRSFGADVAIAVTGIAGPGGGTDAKPVGLMYVGGGGRRRPRGAAHVWDGDRHGNKLRERGGGAAAARWWIEATMTRLAADIGAGPGAGARARPIRAGERIHVVGAAGAGASAAVLLAHRAGAAVSGCDPGGQSPYTARS